MNMKRRSFSRKENVDIWANVDSNSRSVSSNIGNSCLHADDNNKETAKKLKCGSSAADFRREKEMFLNLRH